MKNYNDVVCDQNTLRFGRTIIGLGKEILFHSFTVLILIESEVRVVDIFMYFSGLSHACATGPRARNISRYVYVGCIFTFALMTD